ncbi:MAG: putative DNA-binding domain-containing protein [Deltaproteobacteria bacterium]|nr:putative DNA-binding domain-containing protein [Deltaproteobacteria bacterium]
MRLSDVQRLFYEAVRADTAPPEVATVFVGTPALSAHRRMNIYHSAYFARQEEVLSEIFPRVKEVAAAATFRRWVKGYLLAHPSARPAIEWIGARFPGYVAAAEAPRAVADLARLEWARTAVLLAPDAPAVLTLGDISAEGFAGMKAALTPGVELIEIDREALALHRGESLETLERAASPTTRVGCVVYRRGHAVLHRSIGAEELRALRLVERGETFASVCAAFEGPGAARAAAQAVRRFIDDTLIAVLDSARPEGNMNDAP